MVTTIQMGRGCLSRTLYSPPRLFVLLFAGCPWVIPLMLIAVSVTKSLFSGFGIIIVFTLLVCAPWTFFILGWAKKLSLNGEGVVIARLLPRKKHAIIRYSDIYDLAIGSGPNPLGPDVNILYITLNNKEIVRLDLPGGDDVEGFFEVLIDKVKLHNPLSVIVKK